MQRRTFLSYTGAALAALATTPSLVLSSSLDAKIRLGCATITWGDALEQAFIDASDLGYSGVQIRENAFKAYQQNPEELSRKLAALKLEASVFSGGILDLATDRTPMFIERAKWLKRLAGDKPVYMQVISPRRSAQAPSSIEIEAIRTEFEKLGKAIKAEGVQMLHHNHMDFMIQNPEEVAALHAKLDPALCGLLLDVAHYTQAGGDPAQAIRAMYRQITALHLKDVANLPPAIPEAKPGYAFVPLGEGRVDLPSVFKALNAVSFSGWAMIELDAVPQSRAGSTPKECAATSMSYYKAAMKQ